MPLALLLFALVVSSAHLSANDRKAKTLYSSLDPKSVSQHLALYELYPHLPEGKAALDKAWTLLAGGQCFFDYRISEIQSLPLCVEGIVALVNKNPGQHNPHLAETDLNTIDQLAKKLANRSLRGHYVVSETELFDTPSEEIDIARAVLLSQLGADPKSISTIRSYEAMIDLMALQILARLPNGATIEQKIREINNLIFNEIGFRFPPHSEYAKDVDLYTFLPSVLDSRHGVCLGVSILYLSLAQRLGLHLESVTPPGHIYIRYKEGDKEINIETTARGIHLDSEEYLGVDTRHLQTQTLKETIGLIHINQASVHFQEERYEKSLECYFKALPYLPHDAHLKELMGYCHILVGNLDAGKALLREAMLSPPLYTVSEETLAEDYLHDNVDAEGLKAIFLPIDEKRESILKKKEALEKALERNPRFRDGWMYLAIAWLQLHREKEALRALEEYHTLNDNDATAEYYLAVLYAKRYDCKRAWQHFRNAEKIVLAKQHRPKALKNLKRELSLLAPE